MQHLCRNLSSTFLQNSKRWFTNAKPSWLHVNEKVKEAVRTNKAVVALESTILTHGLPYPQNENLAQELEDLLYSLNVQPATIAFVNGKLKVGVSQEELQLLCRPYQDTLGSPKKRKISRHDLAHAIASSCVVGGTTVSATMIGAYLAGISVFATGGLGGVHRDFVTSHDISSDLTELSQLPVCVVCAGVKSILDIRRTIEVLETFGVNVATLGSDEFPAFFSSRSGVRSPSRVNTCQEAARLYHASLEIPNSRGTVIAVPPKNLGSVGDEIENAILTALKELEEPSNSNVQGRESTPHILARVNELTRGLSLQRNLDLVKNNVQIAADIATELTNIRAAEKTSHHQPSSTLSISSTSNSSKHFDSTHSQIESITVIGASNLDTIVEITDPKFHSDLSNLVSGSYEGRIMQSCGGVARNLAEVLTRLSSVSFDSHKKRTPIEFLSCVRNDFSGRYIIEESSTKAGMKLDHVRVIESSSSTASYATFLDKERQVLFGVNDSDLYKEISPDYIRHHFSRQKSHNGTRLIVADANLSMETLHEIIRIKREFHTLSCLFFYEPTNVFKANKVIQAGASPNDVDYVSPNIEEFQVLYEQIIRKEFPLKSFSNNSIESFYEAIKNDLNTLQQFIPNWIIKLGPRGVLLCPKGETPRWYGSLVSETEGCISPSTIVNVSGAGDSLVGTTIYLKLVNNTSWDVAIRGGLLASATSLLSQQAIAYDLVDQLRSVNHILERTKHLPVVTFSE